MTDERTHKAIRHIIGHCGGLAAGERVAVVSDPRTFPMARLFAGVCREWGVRPAEARLAAVAACHGAEPGEAAARAMREADLIIGLTWMSLAHTRARLEAARAGARYLSLPQYDEKMLAHPALTVDYRSLTGPQLKIAAALTAGRVLRFTTPAGSDVSFDITGRGANFCPGFLDAAIRLASPPDIEVNISPVETATEGLFVVDGSVALEEIGRPPRPLRLKIEKGAVTDIESEAPGLADKIKEIFRVAGEGRARVVGEFGLGFNPEAAPCGNMLLDEGSFGCVHLGCGSNATMGGLNSTPFHLDFIAQKVSAFIDGQPYMRDGVCL